MTVDVAPVACVDKAFDACGGEACFRDLELVQRGWIRGDLVLARYRSMRAAHASGDPRYAIWSLRLWMVFGLELWLRHRGHQWGV